MILTLAISGYRSLRDVVLPLDRLNVVTGPNGSGKSSFYRALRLLSDGTLRYLLLIAALMTPRPPSLMVLNEPETSLHPDLLPPLARLIAHAARESEIIVVSHATPLVAALAEADDCLTLSLAKELGETVIRDVTRPRWTWPSR